MIRPLALFIGLRYTRAKRRNHFISFIAMASMLGIALGVMVLITVLSVMNGFDQQIRTRFFALAPQVTVMTNQALPEDWQVMQRDIDNVPGVVASAPYASGQGMLVQDSHLNPIEVFGIDPNQEQRISQLGQKIVAGQLSSLQSGTFNMILGQEMANRLGVNVGDKVSLLTPQANNTPLGIFPRVKQFKVSGVFHASSGFGFDLNRIYISRADAKKLYAGGDITSGFHIKVDDLYQADPISLKIQEQLPLRFLVTNWTKQYGAFFHALAMEKTMLFVILLLIIAVAVFNLVSTLVMVVNEKRADIAILRTLGATPRTIMATFIIQGALIGFIGTVLGLMGGLLLASNVTHVADALQHVLGVQLVPSSVYFIDYLPSKIALHDVVQICLIAFILSVCAALYPAWVAFRTQPAEALRYE